MSELSRTLGNMVSGQTVEACGKTYTIRLIDQKFKVDFENGLYKFAKDAIVGLRKDVSSEEYLELLTKLTDSYESGEFAFEGVRGRKALNSARGSTLMVSLLCNCSEAEALKIMVENREEMANVMQLVMRESFPGVEFKKKEVEQSNPQQEAISVNLVA